MSQATQLTAGLGIRALDLKPKEFAFPPHGDSNKWQSLPRVAADNTEMSREQAPAFPRLLTKSREAECKGWSLTGYVLARRRLVTLLGHGKANTFLGSC